MKNLLSYLKKQPLSCLLIAAIWIVCMIPIPDTPLDDVKFIDKWTHLVMYGGLVSVIMVEFGRRRRSLADLPERRRNLKRMLFGGLLLPIVMGGLVELAQAYLTNGVRSGDWLDFVADSCGALIGAIIGIPLALYLATRNKDA